MHTTGPGFAVAALILALCAWGWASNSDFNMARNEAIAQCAKLHKVYDEKADKCKRPSHIR